MDRIKKLCAYMEPCETLIDVGCDHGYCTELALNCGLCKRAIVTDISGKSLKKAEELLKDYIACGKCRSIVCDGLTKVEEDGLVLIAGMGGEEIIKILTNAPHVPASLLLQPMKNADKVRSYLLSNGYRITADDIFYSDKKYYFVVRAMVGEQCEKYSEAELAFGRDSLKNPVFSDYLKEETAKLAAYLCGCPNERTSRLLRSRLNFLKSLQQRGD